MHVVHKTYCYRKLSVCLSVCPSVTLMICDHIRSSTSKVIKYYSVVFTLWSSNIGDLVQVEHLQISHRTGVGAVFSRKKSRIGPRLLLMTNCKFHMRFPLVPKSLTLDDLERPLCTLLHNKLFSEPTKKIWKMIDPYCQRQNVVHGRGGSSPKILGVALPPSAPSSPSPFSSFSKNEKIRTSYRPIWNLSLVGLPTL